MRRSRKAVLSAIAAVLSVVGCRGDVAVAPSMINATAPARDVRAAAEPPIPPSLTELTRFVALAMRDAGLRHKVKNDLRNSRLTREHKLILRSYLHGNGGILRQKMAQRSGRSPAYVDALLDTVGRELEFYMPVEAHRAAWAGDTNLIVASTFGRDGLTPAGFDLDGRPVRLSGIEAPQTPTLALLPLETQSTKVMPASAVNDNDQGGQSIGTWERPGAKRSPSKPSGPGDASPQIGTDPCAEDPFAEGCATPATPGLRLAYLHLDDWKEDWIRGDPEVEIFLIGPTVNLDADGERLKCGGQGAAGANYFDMNGHDVSPGYYYGLLYSQSELGAYYQVYNKQFAIQVWEDDDTACEIRGEIDRHNLAEFAQNVYTTYRNIVSIVRAVTSTTFDVAADVRAANAVRSIAQSDDDFLGSVIDQQLAGFNYPDATHVIILRQPEASPPVLNGRARLFTSTH